MGSAYHIILSEKAQYKTEFTKFSSLKKYARKKTRKK